MTPALAAATVAVSLAVLCVHGFIAMTLASCRHLHPSGAWHADLNVSWAGTGALAAFAYLVIGSLAAAKAGLPSWVPHAAKDVAGFALVQVIWTGRSVLDLLELRLGLTPGRHE